MGFAAAAPWIIQGLGFLGGILGNRGQKQQQTSQTQSNSGSNFKTSNATGSSVNPLLAPGYAEYINNIKDKYLGLINTDPNLTGYTASGVSDINNTSNAQRAAIEANLASRGVTGPAASTSLNANDANRFANITKFKQTIPLLSRQLQQDTLDKALGVFNAMPRGTYTETAGGSEGFENQFGNQATQGTTTQPGNMLGGGIGNLANLMAFLYGQGAFGNGPNRLPTQTAAPPV